MNNAKTILVVEDEEALQDAIKMKLTEAGYNILTASSAEKGLEVLEKAKELPDLIWLDLLLPGMGGFNFLEILRSNPKFRNVMVLIVSVSASPEKIQRAFQLNVVDYIVKSQYRLEDIVGRIDHILKAEKK